MKLRTPAVDIGFPFRVDDRGRTAVADLDRHVRDLVEQVLFTSPGERLNRPDFGTHLRHAVFSPASSELASALEHMIQGALQQWLSDALLVQRVGVEATEDRLVVDVVYQVLRNRELREARFEKEL